VNVLGFFRRKVLEFSKVLFPLSEVHFVAFLNAICLLQKGLIQWQERSILLVNQQEAKSLGCLFLQQKQKLPERLL
jgi:hypothetical protein